MPLSTAVKDVSFKRRFLNRIHFVPWTSFFAIMYAALFIALASQVKIKLPFTPVLLTGQTFAVMLAGALLGSRRGALAAVVYLAQGALGMPVWANGASSMSYLMTPVGGYYFAFILQAYMTGIIAKSTSTSSVYIFMTLLLTCFTHLLLGSVWLGMGLGMDFGWEKALVTGFVPFIPGEIVKCLMITWYLKKA
ncbi:MAG: biotin transporter BioY [Candidatus Rhabdochlamydia sp.]